LAEAKRDETTQRIDYFFTSYLFWKSLPHVSDGCVEPLSSFVLVGKFNLKDFAKIILDGTGLGWFGPILAPENVE
jgi:hypothetical protein